MKSQRGNKFSQYFFNKKALEMINACKQANNQKHPICENLLARIAAGDALLKEQKNFRTITRKTDAEKGNITAIFTDTNSEQYCEQSLHLNEMLGSYPREIKNSHYDLKKILKFRLSEHVHLCVEKFPADLPSEELLEIMCYPMTPKNPEHVIYKVHQILVKITDLQQKSAEEVSLVKAGREVMRVMIDGGDSPYKDFIASQLKSISKLWIRLGCEPMRLAHAQKLTDLNPKIALYVVSKVMLSEVEELMAILTKKKTASYMTILAKSDDLARINQEYELVIDCLTEKLNVSTDLAIEAGRSYPKYICLEENPEELNAYLAKFNQKNKYSEDCNTKLPLDNERNVPMTLALNGEPEMITQHPSFHSFLPTGLHQRLHHPINPTLVIAVGGACLSGALLVNLLLQKGGIGCYLKEMAKNLFFCKKPAPKTHRKSKKNSSHFYYQSPSHTR